MRLGRYMPVEAFFRSFTPTFPTTPFDMAACCSIFHAARKSLLFQGSIACPGKSSEVRARERESRLKVPQRHDVVD